jgi:adenylate kinase family enzyme
MLVPEDIIFGLLSKRLEDGYYKGETGFILDGIPRSRLQAVSLHCQKLDSSIFRGVNMKISNIGYLKILGERVRWSPLMTTLHTDPVLVIKDNLLDIIVISMLRSTFFLEFFFGIEDI